MGGHYFDHLNYSLGDEDAGLEQALAPSGRGTCVAIAGCGSRLIPLLARRPARLVLCDTSGSQLHLTALRLAALRAFDRDEYIAFLGFGGAMRPDQRQSAFAALPLDDEVRASMQRVLEREGWGPIAYLGRFERTMARLARLNALVTGAAGRGLFDATSLADQQAYYASRFPHRRWRQVLFVLGNSAVLNALLYRGEFPRKNLPASSYVLYRDIFDRLFTRIPARESAFLQMVFFGRVRFPEGYPAECTAATYDAARAALEMTEIRLERRDVLELVTGETEPIDYLALSDVPSFLGAAREMSFLDLVAPGVAAGASVVVRGHLRVLHPSSRFFEDVTSEHEAVIAAERTQLWTIHVYRRRAEA